MTNYWFYGKNMVQQVNLMSLLILMFFSNPSKLKSKTKKCNQLEHFLENSKTWKGVQQTLKWENCSPM